MGLLDAKEYDPRPMRRRIRLILGAVAIVAIPLAVWYWYFFIHFGPERREVNKFMEALERQDFDTAYGIKNADPNWKQHPEKYNEYSISQFKLDWGPSGDYGKIVKHSIDCVLEPPRSSGVIVSVIVNGRAEPASLWVEKTSKTITQSPSEVQCHPPQ